MSITDLAQAIIRNHNFEVGFAKVASDTGLTEDEYNAVRAAGIRQLQKQAEQALPSSEDQGLRLGLELGKAQARQFAKNDLVHYKAPTSMTPGGYTLMPAVQEAEAKFKDQAANRAAPTHYGESNGPISPQEITDYKARQSARHGGNPNPKEVAASSARAIPLAIPGIVGVGAKTVMNPGSTMAELASKLIAKTISAKK
jgi:hypothetical protein